MKIDSDLGDAWALFYKFELQHGTEVCTARPGSGAAGWLTGCVGVPMGSRLSFILLRAPC